MKRFFKKLNNQKGYAILFAVVIVSIITLLSLGLSSTTYKQLILSSLASDSQMSYFQSDTATECALYSDLVLGMTYPYGGTNTWSCGQNSTGTGNYSFNVSSFGSVSGYKLTNSAASSLPCFEFDVDQSVSHETKIYARGYNSCDKTSMRTVEREIKITYTY